MPHSHNVRRSWPEIRVNEAGHLLIGECDAVELAARFGTPLYVFDEAAIRRHCREFRQALAPAGGIAAYAGKAFLTAAMVRIIAGEGLHLDVVSGGELHTALAAGFPPERIIYHGNNKTEAEVARALTVGVSRLVVDNFDDFDLIEETGRRLGRVPGVLIRVAPGIEAHTHEFISTGQEDSKFGFDLGSGQALAAIERAAFSDAVDWCGIHCHVGSQIFELEPFRLAAQRLIELAARARESTGKTAREIDIGGGFSIRYVERDRPPAVSEAVGAAVRALREDAEGLGLTVPRLIVEPGRAIVGDAGYTLYTVGTRKRIPGVRTYVAVDGGMADNPRPALYGAEYTAMAANKAHLPAEETVRLVGRYCESGDVIISEASLPTLLPGDLIAVFSTGAYHYSMSSNYNRYPRPAVVLVNGHRADVIVERETYDDLISRDRVPARLKGGGRRRGVAVESG